MNQDIDYKIRLSEAITWLRFPLIFLIIMLHCYSVQRLEGDHDTYFKVLYPFSLWLGETGVPGFFFISGYLFFLSKKTYLQKIKTRIYTLLTPYLLWNLIFLMIYLASYALGYPQDINRRNMADYQLIDYLRLFWDRGEFDHGNFVPILCPMWYIRNLFIISLISPILYYLIRFARELFIIAVALWWMTSYHNAFISQTVLFFSLGAYFSILENNPLKVVTKGRVLFIVLFLIFATGDILTHVSFSSPYTLQIHRIALICNIPALILLAEWRTQTTLSKRTQFLSQAAFIVFCVHYPIVLLLRKICVTYFMYSSDSIHILLYFVCIIITTFISIGFYWILYRYFPKLKTILSGNR